MESNNRINLNFE